jgi:hypothetical protein
MTTAVVVCVCEPHWYWKEANESAPFVVTVALRVASVASMPVTDPRLTVGTP